MTNINNVKINSDFENNSSDIKNKNGDESQSFYTKKDLSYHSY